MTLHATGSAAMRFVRSVVALAVLALGVPSALVWSARHRFGGASPMHGVQRPGDWSGSRVWSALTDRLTEQTVADVVIRLALVVAWAGLVVFLVTVVAEAVHMVRHAGMHLPDVRGLGLTQHSARIVAAGLLVILPALSSPGRVIARGDTTLTPLTRAAAPAAAVHQIEASHSADPVASSPAGAPAALAAGGRYAVRPGDSIYGIASQIAGPDASSIASYAERIVDLNLGRDMGYGERFTNAAFIDVGWMLDLPETDAAPTAAAPTAVHTHTVAQGETLWSIADDELGDPHRWPEVYDANAGRTFDDGRTLDDPATIHPGWEVDLPDRGEPAVPVDASPAEAPVVAAPSDAEPVAVLDTEAPAPDIAVPDIAVPDLAVPDVSVPEAPGPINEWAERPSAAVSATHGTIADGVGEPNAGDAGPGDAAPIAGELVSIRQAAMLSVGVLTLLAARRRTRLRQAAPRARLPDPTPEMAATERALRATDPGERMARVDIAVRAAALALVDHGRRVLAVLSAPDGAVELLANGSASLPPPFIGSGARWTIAATTPIEMLASLARQVGSPCPTLVQLGIDDSGRDVYVDLEALEAIEVGGSSADADAIVAAAAVMLAGSALAEVTTMVAVDVPDDAFLGHRLHRSARDATSAFDLAAKAIGATAAATSSTFELRARVTSGEMWEPAVVLVGSGVDVVRPPRHRTGLAVVSAARIEGPSSCLTPAGDMWQLLPLGLMLHPIGVRPAELDALADLVDGAGEVPLILDPDDGTACRSGPLDANDHADPDDTVVGFDDVVGSIVTDPRTATHGGARPAIRRPDGPPPPSWDLLVRLLGSVSVVDRDGRVVEFERSKTRELVAWLATHRDRATRSNARTALWEHDVRDATFANVVSEARRSLARLVEPPAGDEWVGRTMTDALPLHSGVVTDADLVEHALRSARLQPPDQAIVTLGPAAEWVAGIPFEGTSYLWPDAEGLTSNLTLLATSVTAELAAHCLSVGDIDGVFRATGRGLRVLAGHEELIGLRMRAHARVGDLAGVRHEWESYERMINADPWSDGEPSPKLVDLRRQLLNPSR